MAYQYQVPKNSMDIDMPFCFILDRIDIVF